AQVSRVSARVPFVEQLEGRLNGLNALSGDVDQKLEQQLTRRAELETLKTDIDGLAQQMVDAQLKLDSVRQLQQRLVPLVAELNALKSDITTARDRLNGVKFDEATVAEQEKRFADLLAASKTVATEVAERTRQMHTLSEEL